MFSRAWKRWQRLTTSGTLALGLALGAGSAVRAQTPGGESATIQDLQRRLEALEKQNQLLMQMIQQKPGDAEPQDSGPPAAGAAVPTGAKADVEKIVKDYLSKDADDKKKKDDEAKKKKEDEGYTVGADLAMKAKWDNGLWLETEDKAFRFHVGGRTQVDSIWYSAGDNVMFGNNGTGRIDDGVAFRRGRFAMEGTLWEVIDFNCEYDFVNTDTVAQNAALAGNVLNAPRRVYDTPVPTDVWVTFTKIPVIGNVRIGNQKPPISFEHLTSSRYLNFLERSYGFDAFVGGPDNGFAPGIQVFNNFCDDRVHLAAGLTKFNQHIYGFNTGDGEWAGHVRAGIFPWWEHDGRYALWLGVGYRHNDPDFLVGNNRQFGNLPQGQVRLRSRTLLRNGPAELHTPLVDIFPSADSQDLLVPEFAMVVGPWTFQGEYFASWLHNARDNPAAVNRGTAYMQSAYVEALYFLTGEHRVFNRKTPGFNRVTPHENFWLVDGCDGPLLGRGAWQVGARYSWVDLDDKLLGGGSNMRGSAQSVTLGLNWFINPSMKLQWNYVYEMRYNINRLAGPLPAGMTQQSSDGDLSGFGMRMAIDW